MGEGEWKTYETDQGYEGWSKYNRNWNRVNIFFFFLNSKDMLSEQ